jgi:branched-chain amino acid transport system ATP-binding protein
LSAVRGGAVVVRNVSFSILSGKVFGLLGANGAGKSTTVDAICGFVRKSGGRVHFAGGDITQARPEALARRGLVQVSQDRDLFPSLTVRENLVLGAYAATSRVRREAERLAEVLAMFPRLQERITSRAGDLSGGEQQMLAIGRALMSEPVLLLLDEPMSGLAPVIVAEVEAGLRELRAAGQSILLVEQNVDVALRLCDELAVLRSGEIVFQGDQKRLGAEPRKELGKLYV